MHPRAEVGAVLRFHSDVKCIPTVQEKGVAPRRRAVQLDRAAARRNRSAQSAQH
jgi:hypothetical protein